MPRTFQLGHLTDSVIGRIGTTMDWPKSLLGYDFHGWGNYRTHPLVGWVWQDVLKDETNLIARNAVQPFALF